MSLSRKAPGLALAGQSRPSSRRRTDLPAPKALRDNQIPPRTMATSSRTSSQRIPRTPAKP
jgi:hypothetical protein